MRNVIVKKAVTGGPAFRAFAEAGAVADRGAP